METSIEIQDKKTKPFGDVRDKNRLTQIHTIRVCVYVYEHYNLPCTNKPSGTVSFSVLVHLKNEALAKYEWVDETDFKLEYFYFDDIGAIKSYHLKIKKFLSFRDLDLAGVNDLLKK